MSEIALGQEIRQKAGYGYERLTPQFGDRRRRA